TTVAKTWCAVTSRSAAGRPHSLRNAGASSSSCSRRRGCRVTYAKIDDADGDGAAKAKSLARAEKQPEISCLMPTHPTQYAHPEALVETDWLGKHLKDEDIRIVESNEDVLLYDTGHIPGAKNIEWKTATNDHATCKHTAELDKIYLDQCNGNPDTDTVIFYRL